MQLKPYPEYKKAGVSWLGSIPSHWPEKRAKYYFKEIDERSQTGDEEMLSVSHLTGVTPRSQKNVTMFKAESNVGQKRCQPGDVVINTMWAWMSALGVANHAGIVSPAYGVYRPINDQEYDTYYLDHLLRIAGYRSEYICRSTGIRSSRLRLYPDKFLSMRVVCPPWEEQQTITKFLKAQNLLFRKFIRNKRRLIELLKEQKQHIINQAVTRGVDPNVKLKPSGVEWIGDIPEHWEALTFGRIVKLFKTGPFGSLLHQSDYVSTGVPIVNPVHMSGGRITPDMNCTVDDTTYHRLREYALAEGDIVFSRRGELGRCALVREEQAGWLIGTGSIRARLSPNTVNHEYLIIALQGQCVADYLSLMSVGATMQSLNTGILNRLPLSLPPLEEQGSILGFIEKESWRINEAITRTQREIELMREYRTRLIADVVTGQLDVRGTDVPEDAEEAAFDEEDDIVELSALMGENTDPEVEE